VWGYGFLFVTAISSCSVIGAFLLPLVGMRFYDGLMTTLIGLAMGSLSGSALFHLLPQVYCKNTLWARTFTIVRLELCVVFFFFLCDFFKCP
jgi:hypothetical protein